jgi:hypothetical protein
MVPRGGDPLWNTHFAPEAMYCLVVAHYKAMNGISVIAIEAISRGQTT